MTEDFYLTAFEAITVLYACPMCDFTESDRYLVEKHIKDKHTKEEIMDL